jgi:hypothetical protein
VRRLLALVLVCLLGACGGGGGNDDPPAASDETLSFVDTAPPWPVGDRQADRIRAARLPLLKAEGQLVHYHLHLDVFHDGEKVTVPANIGVDLEERVISPLHTHSPSGVIHVEANEDEELTLGQFLTEWGVKASDGCVADKCGEEVVVFVNGSIQDVPAADLVIKPDTQISLVLGTPPADIPSNYDCKAEDPGDFPCS